MRTLCRTWLGRELWWRERRRRRRRKERREIGEGERERRKVDEQAATQRGSSKQHNAASRLSLPPRRPDAPAPLSVAALEKKKKPFLQIHARSASPASKKRGLLEDHTNNQINMKENETAILHSQGKLWSNPDMEMWLWLATASLLFLQSISSFSSSPPRHSLTSPSSVGFTDGERGGEERERRERKTKNLVRSCCHCCCSRCKTIAMQTASDVRTGGVGGRCKKTDWQLLLDSEREGGEEWEGERKKGKHE